MAKYDFSDLNTTSSKSQYDFSDLNTDDQRKDEINTSHNGSKKNISDIFFDPLENQEGGFADTSGFNAILGTGDSLRNLIASTLNLAPGVNIPMAKSSSGNAYDVGKFVGDVGGFAAGGEVLDTGRAVAELAPYISGIAKFLGGKGVGGIANRAAGSSAYGVIQNPKNKEQAAIAGALTSLIPESAIKGGGKLISSISPKKYSKELQQTIADSLQKSKEKSQQLYGDVFSLVGDKPVIVKSLQPSTFRHTKGLRDVYNDYRNNPNFANAHKLQSQLASEDRNLIAKDQATTDRKNEYKIARDDIKEKIDSFLENKNQAKSLYANANKHYREENIPYAMIHKGIGKLNNPTPEAIVKKITQISNKEGFPKETIKNIDYPIVPDEISNLQNSLAKKIRNRDVSQVLSGAAIGGTAAHSMGLPLMIDILASGSAGTALPYLIKKIPTVPNNKKITNDLLSQSAKKISPLIEAIYKSLLLNQGGE